MSLHPQPLADQKSILLDLQVQRHYLAGYRAVLALSALMLAHFGRLNVPESGKPLPPCERTLGNAYSSSPYSLPELLKVRQGHLEAAEIADRDLQVYHRRDVASTFLGASSAPRPSLTPRQHRLPRQHHRLRQHRPPRPPYHHLVSTKAAFVLSIVSTVEV